MLTRDGNIDYESLVGEAMREAMRGVVRTLLHDVAANGLRGDHHFYISFYTQAPGVTVSKRLLEKYPTEMTIVLQHKFWDLVVLADRFEVKLAFNGIPERLVVPYSALKVFFDPSVRFGHQFDEPEAAAEEATDETAATTKTARPRSYAQRTEKKRPASSARKRPEIVSDQPTPDVLQDTVAQPERPAEKPAVVEVPAVAPAPAPAVADNPKVVSLDQFRKK